MIISVHCTTLWHNVL